MPLFAIGKSRRLVVAALCMECLLTYAQIRFEAGWFVTNDGEHVSGLIRNRDWERNPLRFQFKTSDSAEVRELGLAGVREFSVNGVKYIRAVVEVDQSTDDLQKIGPGQDPVWQTDSVFLKMLVGGSASLYHLVTQEGLERFFFSVKDGDIQQLIYKRFYAVPMVIVINDQYRHQLFMQVNCGESDLGKLRAVDYNRRDLSAYFRKYNLCKGDAPTAPERGERDFFRMVVTPGVNSTAPRVSHTFTRVIPATQLPMMPTFRLGIEAELVMPFNKNKWSAPFEISYQHYDAKVQVTSANALSLKYRAVEGAFGIRYAVYFRRSSRFFVNGFVNTAILDRDRSKLYYTHRVLDLVAPFNFALGAGVAAGPVSLEFRAYTNRNILARYRDWYSRYQVTAVVLGFRFLDQKVRQ